MELIANRRITYAKRRLLPGDRFTADDRVARVLIATKKAAKARPETTEEMPPQDELALLRAEYERVLGKRPFNGWGADTLRQKVAAVKAKE